MAFFNRIFNRNGRSPAPIPSRIDNTSSQVFNNLDQNLIDIINNRSVINSNLHELNPGTRQYFDSAINSLEPLPIISDKYSRITHYRTIADFPECSYCLDEIVNEFIHSDENSQFIYLLFKGAAEKLNANRQEVLTNEFYKFINLFDFENNGPMLLRKLLVEGEIAFENIIDPDNPDLGIIGVKYLPTEYFDSLVDQSTGQKVGIYFDITKYARMIKTMVSSSYYGAHNIFNSIAAGYGTVSRENSLVFLWPQITYISSGSLSPDGLITYPLIEKCRQPYYQLVLMQDSAIILRVTHSPERLLFNVDTQGMNNKDAYEYVRTVSNKLKQKKILSSQNPNGEGPAITNMYNPSTMLEAWVFGKNASNTGTSVESIGSNVSYEQLDDVKYFLKRLFKVFKVPFTRFEAPDQMNQSDDQISYEEYSFSRSITEYQRRFAVGLKSSFITHLKLRGLWDKYSLRDADLKVEFVKPVLYDLYYRQRMVEIKVDTYSKFTDKDEFSKITAMKKFLNMTDEEINENYNNLIKEKMLLTLGDWYSSKLESDGPATVEPPIPISGLVELDQEPEEDADLENDVAVEPSPEEEESDSEEALADDSSGGTPPGFGF